ncbi:hypothetical protein GCM10025865_29880 [Paraoerskovia sediminicola]|uniref:Prepilin type IV endopeptidase peptidase domain-containing protein n=1 Tax=Paraoerskovia sediminicola TaxID=1138587 RepID=A0ABM8G6D8_9CELL|nr:A24 family peptidase [Paraoerskovia sediminicola]BDZ43689.1 hypothetical protein GCM10025865_29880 [Paraoerskovia sediminicola]
MVIADVVDEVRPFALQASVLGSVSGVVGAAWALAHEVPWVAPAFAVVAAAGAVLSVIDARTHRLPDPITIPSTVVVIALLVAASLLDGDPAAAVRAVAGSAAAFVFYLALALVSPDGLGFGDVKLSALLGAPLAWLGWGPLLGGTVLAFVLGGLVALGLVLARRATRTTRIPFGPYMVVGAVLAVAAAGTP